jgi:outer membrane protein TolC
MRGKKILGIVLIVLALVRCGNLVAQESMMGDINNILLHKLIDTAKAYYPKYKWYKSKIAFANYNLQKNKISWVDPFNFSIIVSPQNTTTQINPSFFNGYQFSLFINLASLLQKPYLIKQSKEEIKMAQNDKDEYDLNLEAEVKSRYYRFIQATNVLKIVSKSAIDAESISKTMRSRFERSEETFENYNKSLIITSEQKQKVIESEGALLITKARLEELLGKRLEDFK